MLPLNGIRILDLSRLLPGPYLTQLLADLGAEVVKIETPRLGDYARSAPPEMGLGGLFEAVNRGKKSAAINYRNPRGRELFLKLAATADVVLEGFRPGAVKKWGIDYEAVRAVNADIVYCSLSGYGQEGPYRDRAGHDLNYLAVGGAVALNARAGEAPVPFGLPAADLSGGMLAAIAILSALVGRQRIGEGAYLDMALLDGVISWMTPLAAAAFFSGLEVSAGSLPLVGGQPCFNIYETADGKYLTLAALEPAFWEDFCKVTGREDLLSRQFDRAIGGEIAAVFRRRTMAEWLSAFAGTDGCVEPVNSFEEMLAHPQIRARGYVREENGRAAGMNSPFVFARRASAPAPRLGEQTREVLRGIGIGEEEIEGLAGRGVIGL
ncbi:MAG: putative acyl-CoA transferase/carnitine dehydratase [Anaerolineaceae bacterium]|nr:MAG: putative acyl-CoA transferase/carnitine dehydratase [Anaerolineaceae bacterium]